MERIRLQMSMLEVAMVMSEGNPGALDCICGCLKHGVDVNPDVLLGGFMTLTCLDRLGIYGTEIYLLWNDLCKRDLVRFMAVVHAVDLGVGGITSDHIHLVMDKSKMRHPRDTVFDIDAVLDAVCTRLPNFNRDWKEPAICPGS